MRSIGKSGFRSENLDFQISNRTQNLKTDFVADSLIGNPCRVRISINKIRREIRFRILCSIGNPKIQILRSKSGFPNRTHPTNPFLDFPTKTQTVFSRVTGFLLETQYFLQLCSRFSDFL